VNRGAIGKDIERRPQSYADVASHVACDRPNPLDQTIAPCRFPYQSSRRGQDS
jgi:hypothetical protein